MGIANDLKGLTMFGRFAPNSLALLAVVVIVLQIVYNSPALAKPRPQQFLNTKQWTGSANDRHWSDSDSIETPLTQRLKRRVSEQEDILKDQNGFKVLTASTEKREGIQTPIEPLHESSVSNHGSNLKSLNDADTSGISGTARANINSGSAQSRSGVSVSKPNEVTPSGNSVSSGNNDANGQKREDVSKASKTTNNNNDTPKDKNDKASDSKTQDTQSSPNSVTVQGNTVNGRPISSLSSDPVRDPLGNSGAEVVTSHPLFEDRAQNERGNYLDARSEDGERGGSKETSSGPEVGHFQVDDKSADLEINANSAGVKVKAKPASLQVVSRPGAHPPTPVVPVAPINPFYHHHHFHPFYDGYRRRRMGPLHRRYYNSPYHAHYRNWIPPPHFHRYWRHYLDDEPAFRRSYEQFPYPYHHRHHHHYRYPDSDLYERSRMEEMYEYPRFRRRFHGPYIRHMYDDDFETRFHIPRVPRPFVRHDIVTPVPPPVNVYGNPPPAILNGSPAARFFGPNLGPFTPMPMAGMMPAMYGPGPGFMGPGMPGFGMFGPGMPGPMAGLVQGFGEQESNETPRNVKKASIQRSGKTKNTKKLTETPKKKSKHLKKILKKFIGKVHDTKSSNSNTFPEVKHRSRRSADAEPKAKKSINSTHHLHPQKKKDQKGARKNAIIMHRPPIIYHPPPEIYHRPDIVVHRAPILLHRPSIIYHQPPVVVHRPAIIYHQPSIVFHQPPPMVHQPIMHSHDTYMTRPMILHSASMLSHATNYLGIPNHVFEGDFGDCHGLHCRAFRKHAVPHKLKTSRAEVQGKISNKSSKTKAKHHSSSRPKRDIYADYIDHLESMKSTWAPRKVKRDLEYLTTKEASSEALTFKNPAIGKRDEISRVPEKESRNGNKRDLDDDMDDSRTAPKKKKDVVVNRPPIIYHPPPEVYHRPDIVVHRPPLVIHRPPIIYHQPPVIVHRPAVVYHQPPIVFHQPPPAVSQPLLFSHDSFTVHPSFYATHHGSVVRDYGHYIGIPNIVSNYGAPLFHSHMGKRSKISKPSKGDKKSITPAAKKTIKAQKKKTNSEKAHKKNSVVIRRPPIIYHPPPEIYHRPDIVVHRAPIMIHRAPIVYHQPPVVVHRPAIVYHQPSLVFHQPPPVVHQPMYHSQDTYVTHSVAVPYESHISHHTTYLGIPKHAYMNYDFHWNDHHMRHGGFDRGYNSEFQHNYGDGYYKSQVPTNKKAAARDQILKAKHHKKSLKKKKSKEEKPKKKNSVVIKRPPIIYHPPPEIFHRPDIIVHRAPILVHRAPIVYHQPPVIVHRPAIVYHQPNIVFHQPSPMVHQPIMRAHDTFVTHPVARLYGTTVHHVGSFTATPHSYYNGEHHTRYLAYGKSKVPISSAKQEKADSRDKIKYSKEMEDLEMGSASGSGDFVEFDDEGSGVSGSADLAIEVVKTKPAKSKLNKSKVSNEDASKKAEIPNSKEKGATDEKAAKGSKKNSVVIHRPPIIYHPPPEIYHRPDIVVHRPPIVLYRAPIIYHQPPVVVHRPAIVYHQPEIVFHQPPPVVHQPIMHSHDTYVTHSVVVPVGSHLSNVQHYHGVPHEEIYMQGIGHGTFSGKTRLGHDSFTKSILPLRMRHMKKPLKVRSRRAVDDLPPGKATFEDSRQPIGAGERIRRAVEEDLEGDENKKDEHAKNKKKKKKDVVVSRPPIIYHPPPEVYHRPEIVVHRAPILIHRPPIVYHQPPVVVHRPAVVYHQPPIVFHQPPPAVNQPLLFSHDQYVLHPSSIAQHINSVVNQGGHYVGIPHGGIENFPHVVGNFPGPMHSYGHPGYPGFAGGAGYKRGKVQRPDKKEAKKVKKEDDDDFSGSSSGEDGSTMSTPKKKKHSNAHRKNNVLVYRPPMIYHPPPEIYDRPDVIVHRPDLVVHQPSIVYHQSSIVIHRPPIVYDQPPIMFHQPPPLTHQPIVTSHDMYAAHQYFEPVASAYGNSYGSSISHVGSYVGAPHYFPGANAYGWNMHPTVNGPIGPAFGPVGPPNYGPYGPGYGPANAPSYGPAVGRSVVEKSSKKSKKSSKKSHKKSKVRSKRSTSLKYHQPTYSLLDHHESFFSNPLIHSFHSESLPHGRGPVYEKSNVILKKISKRSTKGKKRHHHKKGDRKNTIMVHRPPLIYHPPPEIYDRPDVVVHRPDLVFHRPSIVYHQPSVVVHRPPIIYHEPPVVFHQPPPMVNQPIAHSHDTYVAHHYFEPVHGPDGQTASFVQHVGTYTGSPHYYPLMRSHYSFAHAFGKSKISKTKTKKHAKHRSKRSSQVQNTAEKTGSKKNNVLIMRPPLIYHPPPEIYDRPSVIVHRPDLVIHRPSIVYHMPSVVIHRPPIIYQQPPVVFHQPPPMNSQPIIHAHDYYRPHIYPEPYASSIAHAGTYVGAPHHFEGGWGFGFQPHGPTGPVYAKSKVPKSKTNAKPKTKRSTEDNEKNTKSAKEGDKKNIVIAHRPDFVYHPPPEIYDRPDIVVHRPDFVVHQPSIVYHQSSVVLHRPPIVYNQPPIIFHQPPPMVHQPIMHSHETYVGHPYFEFQPHNSFMSHAGSYVGAPHHYIGGFGYGYEGHLHAGHAFAKSKVAKSSKKSKKAEKGSKRSKVDKKHTKKSKSKFTKGHKKNLVVMQRPNVVYHPPPEIYHRPDVILHRPDIVIHRPSVVFHQPAVVVHRPPVVYRQPPLVFHQPPPMVNQPILHSHETYLAHNYFEPHHSHVVHAGNFVGSPHIFHGGWGWGYGTHHGLGHAFGKSKVEGTDDKKNNDKSKKDSEKEHEKDDKENDDDDEGDDDDETEGTKKSTFHHNKAKKGHNKSKRNIHEHDFYSKLFGRVYKKRSTKTDTKKSKKNHFKKSSKGEKKNTVLIHRPQLIYHPPPEIYDRPDVVVHRPDLVYHQPSVVYHQSSVVVHRAPIIYHPPPVVFHQPPPLVHQNVLHAHDTYIAHPYFEFDPHGSSISNAHAHAYHYTGAPHFFGGGWGYGYGHSFGSYGPGAVPDGPFYGGPHGPAPYSFNAPAPYTVHGPEPYDVQGPAPYAVHGPVPYDVQGPTPYTVHGPESYTAQGPAPYTVRAPIPAKPSPASVPLQEAPIAKSDVQKVHKHKSTGKKRHHRDRRNADKDQPTKKSKRKKSKDRHHKGHKKQVVVSRPPIVYHPPSEIYHRPDLVYHRPDIVIHRPPIVMHQAPVVVHKPAIVYHQPDIVVHQPPPVIHQPVLYAHDTYVPRTCYQPYCSHIVHGGYVGPPMGWTNGYGHIVKSKVAKAHKKSVTKNKQVKASKKAEIARAEDEPAAKPSKKNDIVVSRPPIIYHPPPEVYHRPDIVVHRAPIVLHRPPIIYHQPPVVVHRPAVVYHQPPIVFHQPPPAVHQPILHSHDTFVVHHNALYEPRGSMVSHQTNYIGVPSHVEQYDGEMESEDDHHGYRSYHGGYHGGFHGRTMHGHKQQYDDVHYRSKIEHVKEASADSEGSSEDTSEGSSESGKESHSDEAKTRTRRQVLGSHSLYLTETPLNIIHPRAPIFERLQKMSTIPRPSNVKSKRDAEPKRRKRQIDESEEDAFRSMNAGSAPQEMQSAFPYQRFAYPRLPYFQPQNPFLPFHRPEVRVHVETQRSKIPKDKKTSKKPKRQVLPYVQQQVLGPNLMVPPPPARPVPSQFIGFPPIHPVMLPYPYMSFAPKRPRVSINVQSARSKVPQPLLKRSVKGGLFHYKRPKVSVDVHTSKSDIPGSKSHDIVLRSRRQLWNYLPVSPLTTGEYHFPWLLKNMAPLKRTNIEKKTKRSANIKGVDKDNEKNAKRDEFAPQADQNIMPMNSDNTAPLQFNNGDQNNQAFNTGAEGLNELGPGGLNGAAAEPPQTQSFFGGNGGDEQRVVSDNANLQEIAQQQQDQPQVPGENSNVPIGVPQNSNDFQELQAANRMAVPNNEINQLPGQAGPFLRPSAPLLTPPMQPMFPLPPVIGPPPLLRPFAPILPHQLLPLQSPYQTFFGPTAQPQVNVNVNTVKSTLPRVKSKDKVKADGRAGREHNKNNSKRQRISLFQRMPALQVLPQRFLQDGVQIPSFSGNNNAKESKDQTNDVIVTEVRRKHAIPINSSNKETPQKRQFFHLPVQPIQTVQPLVSPLLPLSFQNRPKVHVQVQIAKRKSKVSSIKDGQKETDSVKSKRQIYGMNELPHGLEFPDDKANTSGDKVNAKKFKIRSEEDSEDPKDAAKTVQKRDTEEPKKFTKTKTEDKKRQFVSPFGGERQQDFTGNEEPPREAQQDQQALPEERLPFNPNDPQAAFPQPVPEPPALQPAGVAQPQPLLQMANPFTQPQVNVNVQVAKKSVAERVTTEKHKTFSKRQLFGTVPLLAAPLSLANVNTIAKTGNERSNVPNTSVPSKEKRQIAQPIVAQPASYVVTSDSQRKVNIDGQTSRSDIGRIKRQLYNILSGQQAQAEQKPQVELSRRSLSEQINVKGDKSVPKVKRQLANLINNLLQRRGGPRLLQNILKQRKPSILFSTNNNNNDNQKPIEIFGENPPTRGNNEGRGQPRPNDIGAGSPMMDMTSAPPNAFAGNPFDPAAQNIQQPVNTQMTQQGVVQDQGQASFRSQDEPSSRGNALRYLQNSPIPNFIAQEQARQQAQQQFINAQKAEINAQKAERRMFPPPRTFFPPPMPPPPFLQEPPLPANRPFLQRPPFEERPTFLQRPPLRANPALEGRPPGGLQFGLPLPPMMPQVPPMYPMVPQLPPPGLPPFYPFMFPPMQPGNMGPFGQNSEDDDRPSVSVNVETSRSNIQKSKNKKKP